MSKTKKLPKYVTYQTLQRFAQAADATFAVRLNAMEERLRDEFGAAQPHRKCWSRTKHHPSCPDHEAFSATTYEGNHLAPTPAEGAE